MQIRSNKQYDIAVIGGGPAGMIAAGRAGELGADVVLVEKNRKPGRKLLITGNGRCNITQAEYHLHEMVEKFGKNGRFLYSSLSVFGVKETIAFFEKNGLTTKVERGGRIFPASDRSQDVLNALISYLERNNVKVMCNAEVEDIDIGDGRITRLILKGGEVIAGRYIICTGGKSYPSTGSTGDGFRWAKKLGHQVTELNPALVPLNVREPWVKDLQGLTLKNVEASIFQNNKKDSGMFGEMLFTHFGVSGPIILSMSKRVGQLLKSGVVKLLIDLKPALDFQKLDNRIQRDFLKYQNKMFKNCLNDLLPRTIIPIIIRLSGIEPEKQVNNVTREERRNLVNLLKSLEMTVTGLLGFDNALVTSGGINLKEIDPKTMRSKLVENLFFAGEILDLDGPTGGYNLQVCWSTGYCAGESAAGL